MSLTLLYCTVTFATVIGLVLLYHTKSRASSNVSNRPLPPGPPRWPIIGSLLSLPNNSEPSWIWFTRWANKTGSDTIYLRVLGSDTIVLNTREAASELLEKRSSMYSDRPEMVMVKELVGWKRLLGMADYSEQTKVIRRYMHSSMSTKAMPDWQPQQEQQVYRFLQKLLHSPENLLAHIRHTAGATVVRLTYGYTPKDEGDEYIKQAELVMGAFSLASTPGAFLVDTFPILKYVPWAPFKRIATEWRNQLTELIDLPMEFVREQTQRGVAEPSFVAEWLEEPGHKSDKGLIPAAHREK